VNDVAKSAPEKKTHTLKLTRGSHHLLAKVMADGPPAGSGPITTRSLLWNRIWDRLYKKCEPTVIMSWWKPGPAGSENPPEPLNIDKVPPRPEGLTDVQWGLAAYEWNKTYKAWEETPVEISLTDKWRDACREAVKAMMDPPKDARQQAPNPLTKLLTSSPLAPLVITELGLADPLPVEDDVQV
jgi:hypothetical protein